MQNDTREEDDKVTTEAPPLIFGSHMRCPKCEQVENLLSYRPLRQVEKYAQQTNPIVKCPHCGWLFSPGGTTPAELYAAFDELLREYGIGGSVSHPGGVSARHLAPVPEAG